MGVTWSNINQERLEDNSEKIQKQAQDIVDLKDKLKDIADLKDKLKDIADLKDNIVHLNRNIRVLNKNLAAVYKAIKSNTRVLLKQHKEQDEKKPENKEDNNDKKEEDSKIQEIPMTDTATLNKGDFNSSWITKSTLFDSSKPLTGDRAIIWGDDAGVEPAHSTGPSHWGSAFNSRSRDVYTV